MRTILTGLLIAAGCTALAANAGTAPSNTLPLHIGGRVAQAPAGYSHQWPGIYYEARFTGPTVTVLVSDTANILNIYVDGVAVKALSKPGMDQQIVLDGLGAGPHIVRVEKISETQADTGTLIGITVPSKRNVLPAPANRAHQIEFIGDSYTAGYGNTSGKRQCTKDEIWATTDSQRAWGPLMAKHYNADYQVNAYSGIGIVRNYDGIAPGHVLPVLYPYATFDQTTPNLAPVGTGWNPQIVVIALGGNDFSTPVHAGDKWATLEDLRADFVASYVAFVKTVRASHPAAQFVLLNYGEDEVGKDVDEVVKRLAADGETRVTPYSTGAGFAQTGCDWHLDLNDDRRIATGLITYLDAHPDLWGKATTPANGASHAEGNRPPVNSQLAGYHRQRAGGH